MVGKFSDVLCTVRLYLQLEGSNGGISIEGEHSSMMEDIPAALNMVVEDVS
jgi:hypothetical protein